MIEACLHPLPPRDSASQLNERQKELGELVAAGRAQHPLKCAGPLMCLDGQNDLVARYFQTIARAVHS